MAGGERAEYFRSKCKQSGAENVVAELRVSQQSDHDPQQTENSASGNQAARVKRPRANFAFGPEPLFVPRSASQRTMPPAKIASVVAMER